MPPVDSPGADGVSPKLMVAVAVGEDFTAEWRSKGPKHFLPPPPSLSPPRGEARSLMRAYRLLRLAFALTISASQHSGQWQHPLLTEKQNKLREGLERQLGD